MIQTLQNGLIQIGGENVNNSMFWIGFSYGFWKGFEQAILSANPNANPNANANTNPPYGKQLVL